MKLTLAALLLALVVIQLGALTRLKDAGLGCPDWPGCYGHWRVDSEHAALSNSEARGKAHFEMNHRYIAGSLALLIGVIWLRAWRQRRPLGVPSLLLGLVCFQALLGMWTVTLRLHPLVVAGHLLGGYAVLSGLAVLAMRERRPLQTRFVFPRRWVLMGIVLLLMQIFLGVWVSANYAALVCLELPACHANWDLAAAYQLWGFTHTDFEFGVLDLEARVTLHMVHRIGACVVAVYFVLLAIALWRSADPRLRYAAVWFLGLVGLQICMGLANIIGHLPLWSALLHNLGAALLLSSSLVLLDNVGGALCRALHTQHKN